jgi:hypothetical protein
MPTTCLFLLTLPIGAAACAADLAPETEGNVPGANVSKLVRNDSAATIGGEAASPSAGWYRAVLRSSSGCTATLVAPYLAVSAAHCGSPAVLYYDEGTSFRVARTWVNPYIQAPYLPAWWDALNQAQKAAPGGRQDDWPAMHDHTVMLVPDATPEWMARNGVQQIQIFADYQGTQLAANDMLFFAPWSFWSVGLSGDRRHYGYTKFLAPNVGSITSSPRDGYIERDGVTAGYVQPRPGDSGGPTFWEGPNGYEFTPFQVLIGTTQNGCGGNGPGGSNDPSNRNVEGCTFGGDIAPIGAFNGMSPNQRASAIKNAHWIGAHIADTDGDGVTNACDLTPTDATTTASRCDAPLQNAVAIGAQEVPAAALVPSLFARIPATVPQIARSSVSLCGIAGQAGWYVDKLELTYCDPSSGKTFRSSEFGGNGGGRFDYTCARGYSISRFTVWTNASALPEHRFTGLQAICSNGLSEYGLPPVGREWGSIDMGTAARLSCDGSGKTLRGLLARMVGNHWLSSVYPICE